MEVLKAVGGGSPCTRSHWPLSQLSGRLYGFPVITLTWLNPFPRREVIRP